MRVGRGWCEGGGHLDEGWAAEVGFCRLDGLVQRLDRVVAVLDDERLPAVGLVALADVLREGELRVAVDGDLVVVVEDDELAEAEVAREGGGLGGDALLEAAVTWGGGGEGAVGEGRRQGWGRVAGDGWRGGVGVMGGGM